MQSKMKQIGKQRVAIANNGQQVLDAAFSLATEILEIGKARGVPSKDSFMIAHIVAQLLRQVCVPIADAPDTVKEAEALLATTEIQEWN